MNYVRPFTRSDHETIKSTQTPFIGLVRKGQVVFAYDEDRHRAAER